MGRMAFDQKPWLFTRVRSILLIGESLNAECGCVRIDKIKDKKTNETENFCTLDAKMEYPFQIFINFEKQASLY